MKLGVVLPLFSGDPLRVVEVAGESEELGFDGVFAFDHFFPPGGGSDSPSLEAFTTLAAVAASTDRVALGPLVARASLRPVGLLAKTAAWLDAASGGRFILGIGSGDGTDRPEHDAYGIPMRGREDRRRHLAETVDALKALFAGRPYPGGTLVPAIEGPLLPPPARPGGPPIWVGGLAEPVLRLAGARADGWNGWGIDAEAFEARARVLAESAPPGGRAAEPTWAGIVLVGEGRAELEELQRRRRERGMDDGIWAGTPDELVEFLGRLRRAGATWAILVHAGPKDRRELVAREVLPRL